MFFERTGDCIDRDAGRRDQRTRDPVIHGYGHRAGRRDVRLNGQVVIAHQLKHGEIVRGLCAATERDGCTTGQAAANDDWVSANRILVKYEALCDNANQMFEHQICPFLDLPYQPIETDLVKQTTRPLSEWVENYQDIRAFLDAQETRDRYWLTDEFMKPSTRQHP